MIGIRTRLCLVLTIFMIIFLLWSSVNVWGNSSATQVYAAQSTLAMAETSDFSLQDYVRDMQPGWNLGNSLDARGSETVWGNPTTTQQMIQAIADSGFKSIRIPITWKHRMGNAPDYKIRESFLERVQEVVDWSLEADLYVMINLHHDTDWIMDMPTKHDEVLARYEAAWVQITQYFQDYSHKLMFEGINEPRFDHDWGRDTPEYFALLETLNTSFHTIVRNSGGNNATRPIVLSTLTSAASQARMNELLKTIEALDDERIIATIHYYGFWPFSVNVGGATKFYPEAHRDIIDTFDRIHRTFTAKGIPVIVGEYGLLGFDKSLETIQHGEVLKFFEFVTHYGQEKDLTLMLWDNGQHFDRRALTWRDEALISIIQSGENRSSYAETDTIFIKEGEPVEDVVLPLFLHGNVLESITHQDRSLQQGEDYEVDGEQLIIKSSLLQSLLTDEYGVSATLFGHFSAGPPWQLSIVRYATPVVSSNIGTNMLAVPTEFNGDRLMTLSAKYKGGGNAGPQDWTPFKEFNYAFNVSYEYGAIQLLKEFFNEVRDGEIDIKFYFESGAVIDYEITKEKSSIIGKSLDEPEISPEPEIPPIEEAADDVQETAANVSPESHVPQHASPSEAKSGGKKWIMIAIIVFAAAAGSAVLYYRRESGEKND